MPESDYIVKKSKETVYTLECWCPDQAGEYKLKYALSSAPSVVDTLHPGPFCLVFCPKDKIFLLFAWVREQLGEQHFGNGLKVAESEFLATRCYTWTEPWAVDQLYIQTRL